MGQVDRLRRGLAVRCGLVAACRGRRGRASGAAYLCLREEFCARAWVLCRLGKRAFEVIVELLDTRRHWMRLNVFSALSRYLTSSPFYQSRLPPLTTTTTTTTTMMMMRTTLAAFTTAILATCVLAQDGAPIVYDAIHNISTIEGTWSSGSQHVLTGAVRDSDGLCDHSLSIFSPSGLCKPGGVDLYLPIHSRRLVLFVGTIH